MAGVPLSVLRAGLITGPLLSCLLSLVSSAHAAPCVIKAPRATIASVAIHPKGEEPFHISLAKVPVEVTPSAEGPAELLAKAPLRFTARHPMNKLGVQVARRTSLLDGRLILEKGLTPGFVNIETAAGTGQALEAGRIPVGLPLAELRPLQSPTLPCSALTVSGDGEQRQPPSLVLPEGPVAHVSTSEPISLYSERKRVAPWRIRLSQPLLVIARKGTWVKLQAKWSDGSSLQGWVPSELVTIRRGPLGAGRFGQGMIGLGHLCSRSHGPAVATFQIHAHAPIHSKARGAVWAHTADTLEIRAFPLARSDGWIQIASLDGLPTQPCSEHSKLWVHARHVLWTGKPLERP